ncbi:hypothetical protein J3Q64DRAFT_1867287 [Phycomyces blakesleeanus]|uniref:F-box domain-containing protein n=1 Tax=Phycomyces blakesleeanus TaxID=4837 RepID=A0ABR3ARR1_PHYBL
MALNFMSELPQEVILNISECFSTKDRALCSLVCKTWKASFQESMHYDLTLNLGSYTDRQPLKHIQIYTLAQQINSFYSENSDVLNKLLLEMCSPRLSKSLNGLCKEKTHFSNLGHLQIPCRFEPFMLDGLLGNKIILTLALSKVNVAFNCNAMKSIKRSSPQSFTVIGSLITLDVLRYLSFQCRVLNELRLVRTKVSG